MYRWHDLVVESQPCTFSSILVEDIPFCEVWDLVRLCEFRHFLVRLIIVECIEDDEEAVIESPVDR